MMQAKYAKYTASSRRCVIMGAGLRRIRRQSSRRHERIMLIQVNTDNHISGREALTTRVEATVESALTRFSDRITRVEVHLSDENGRKSGPDDKRCVMEARLQGRQPVAVTHLAATIDDAVSGAADKMTSALDSTLGRLRGY